MIQPERVIFRMEKNPYVQSVKCTNRKSLEPYEETLCNPEYIYLAIFPDDPANPGRVAYVPFFFDGHGTAWFESCGEADWFYCLEKTRIIHKSNPLAEKLLQAVTEYYSTDVPAKFRMVEKMTH